MNYMMKQITTTKFHQKIQSRSGCNEFNIIWWRSSTNYIGHLYTFHKKNHLFNPSKALNRHPFFLLKKGNPFFRAWSCNIFLGLEKQRISKKKFSQSRKIQIVPLKYRGTRNKLEWSVPKPCKSTGPFGLYFEPCLLGQVFQRLQDYAYPLIR